jgi:hypothetical protein
VQLTQLIHFLLHAQSLIILDSHLTLAVLLSLPLLLNFEMLTSQKLSGQRYHHRAYGSHRLAQLRSARVIIGWPGWPFPGTCTDDQGELLVSQTSRLAATLH